MILSSRLFSTIMKYVLLIIIFSLSSNSLAISSHDFVELLHGESSRTYQHSETTINLSKSLSDTFFMEVGLEKSKERNGGFDNNAVIYDHQILKMTHLFPP